MLVFVNMFPITAPNIALMFMIPMNAAVMLVSSSMMTSIVVMVSDTQT